jgi:hypothetical protein
MWPDSVLYEQIAIKCYGSKCAESPKDFVVALLLRQDLQVSTSLGGSHSHSTETTEPPGGISDDGGELILRVFYAPETEHELVRP